MDSFLFLSAFDPEKLGPLKEERVIAGCSQQTTGFAVGGSPQGWSYGEMEAILLGEWSVCFKPDEFPEPVYCLATLVCVLVEGNEERWDMSWSSGEQDLTCTRIQAGLM